MSLLTQVFSFLGIAQYNTTPPVIANGQIGPLQCDANGRLLVTVAAIRTGAPVLALPVATGNTAMPTPTVVNGLALSLPFNTSAAVNFTLVMPEFPVRGMRVLVIDSGGFATTTPAFIADPNGYKIQDPMNPASLSTPYSFNRSGYAAMWEFVTGDPTNGSFWAAVRSLQ